MLKKRSHIIIFLFFIGIMCLGFYGIYHKKATEQTIIIGLAGDTMLGRLVGETLMPMNTPRRYHHPWENLLPQLKNNALNIVNLETTFTKSTNAVPKVFNFKADPDLVNSLVQANIGVVNLANNHILDFAREGFFETIQTLDAAGIKHIGAGETLEKAKEPVIITKNGFTIGVLGYTDNEPTWQATTARPGINYLSISKNSIEMVKQDIALLRPRVDLLIVSLHWGPNMQERPSQEFQNFAHTLIDSGVDIIHGHSAHIFQGIEVYHGKVILYDTGDFVDDYAVDPILRNDRALLFLVYANKKGIMRLQLVPLLISNMHVNYATKEEQKAILERIKMLSAEFGTVISNDGAILIQQ